MLKEGLWQIVHGKLEAADQGTSSGHGLGGRRYVQGVIDMLLQATDMHAGVLYCQKRRGAV